LLGMRVVRINVIVDGFLLNSMILYNNLNSV